MQFIPNWVQKSDTLHKAAITTRWQHEPAIGGLGTLSAQHHPSPGQSPSLSPTSPCCRPRGKGRRKMLKENAYGRLICNSVNF